MTRFRAAERVFDIAVDKSEFACALENGLIEIWDKSRLPQGPRIVLRVPEGCAHGLRIGLAAEFIFGGFFEKSFHAWNRENGKYLGSKNVDSNIHGLKAVSSHRRRNYVVVAEVNGTVDLFAWEDSKESLAAGSNPFHMLALIDTVHGRLLKISYFKD